jgi:hypothetical protein
MDIELVKAIAPGVFTFVGVIVALLWNDQRERREREKRHSRDANMLRRVMTADLEIIKHNALAAANVVRKAGSAPLVTLDMKKVRDYSTEQFGLLTVVEIEPVFVAFAGIETLRTVVASIAVEKKGEAYTLKTSDMLVRMGALEKLAQFCQDAVDELKAETGPE